MNIKELKISIKENSISNNLMIFLYNKDTFLVNQYLNEISERTAKTINNISSLNDVYSSALSLVFDYEFEINVLRTDTFNEYFEDYSRIKNCIVICNKVDESISSLVADYIIEFPNLVDWQIKDYIKIKCKYLEQDEIDWLYNVTSNNIYRCDNEINKISVFNDNTQRKILNELKFEKDTDLYYVKDNFEIVEAIVHLDKLKLLEILQHRNCYTINPFGLVTMLLQKLECILFVNFKSGLSIEEIGIQQKQYNAIKYYYKDCSEKFIMSAIDFLSNIDNRVKSGLLDINKDDLVDYIIINVLNF